MILTFSTKRKNNIPNHHDSTWLKTMNFVDIDMCSGNKTTNFINSCWALCCWRQPSLIYLAENESCQKALCEGCAPTTHLNFISHG